MSFDDAFQRTIGHEGVYSTDRGDPGNYTPDGVFKGTKYGISARSYPSLDIENLTLEKAKQIYRLEYWDKPKIGLLPARIAIQVFDGAVNSGTPKSISWLQKALQVPTDGVIGPLTLLQSAKAPESEVIKRYLGYRLGFMTDLAIWQSQGRGLARRISRNLIGG